MNRDTITTPHTSDYVSMRAMAERAGGRRQTAFLTDALFPQVLDGVADTWGIDEDMASFLTALVQATKPLTILETGTNKGRSTRAIAEGLVANGEGHIYTVDWDDNGLMTSGAIRDNEKPYVTQIIGKTPDVFTAPPLVDLQGIDMAFLDGDHSAEGLAADLEYVDKHRDDYCLVLIDNATDAGFPGLVEYLQNYTKYPHICLHTMCGLEMMWMRS